MAIKKYIGAWPVAMDSFFKLVVFNYIYGNGDAHMKNFSIIRVGDEFRLAPAYDLMNTSLHLNGDDFGLLGGLFKTGWKSDVYDHYGHPCHVDFEEFGKHIGMSTRRIKSIINEFSNIPEKSLDLISQSYLENKMRRKYISILQQRIARFTRNQ